MAVGLARVLWRTTILCVCISDCIANQVSFPEFLSVSIKNADANKVEFEVKGSNIYEGMEIKITKSKAAKNSMCEEVLTNYNLSAIWVEEKSARYKLTVPPDTQDNIYFCLPREAKNTATSANTNDLLLPPAYLPRKLWIHQGEDITVRLENHLSDVKPSTRSHRHLSHQLRLNPYFTVMQQGGVWQLTVRVSVSTFFNRYMMLR